MNRMLVASLVLVPACLLAACGQAASQQQEAVSSVTPATAATPVSAATAATPASPAAPLTPASPGAVLPKQSWGSLFSTMGEEYVAFGERVLGETPTRAYVCYQGEGGGDPIWFDDADEIVDIFNALAATNALEGEWEVRTDDYTSFGFEFADGSRTSFMFDSLTFMVAENNQWKIYGLETNSTFDRYASMARTATLGSYDRMARFAELTR